MIRNAARWLAAAIVCAPFCWGQGMGLVGIAHVAFRVADLDASRAFYQKLGFEQFFEMKQGDRTTEAFLKINDHQFIELYPRTEPAQTLGLMHVCYEASDLAALHDELAGRGAAVSNVRKAGAGNLLMTLKDPEGQTIEYTQYLPGSRHYEDRGKHLGADRVSQALFSATTPAQDAAAVRAFYVEKLGFTAVGARLKIPGDSGQELEVAGKPRITFSVAGARPDRIDPDGVVISFVKAK